MIMIKAIIFDYGNVIEKINDDMFLRSISGRAGKSVIELRDLIYNSDLPERYESGLVSSGEFYQEVVKRCNMSMSIPDFIDAYTSVNTPIETTIELIRKLKKKYKLAMLSNTSEWDYERIIMKSEIFKLFDAVTVSFKVKLMKPDRAIYDDVIKKLRVKPAECAYVDDLREYVDGAVKAGANGIRYTSYNVLIKSLKKLKVNI